MPPHLHWNRSHCPPVFTPQLLSTLRSSFGVGGLRGSFLRCSIFSTVFCVDVKFFQIFQFSIFDPFSEHPPEFVLSLMSSILSSFSGVQFSGFSSFHYSFDFSGSFSLLVSTVLVHFSTCFCTVQIFGFFLVLFAFDFQDVLTFSFFFLLGFRFVMLLVVTCTYSWILCNPIHVPCKLCTYWYNW